jgi:hypothetical protein
MTAGVTAEATVRVFITMMKMCPRGWVSLRY